MQEKKKSKLSIQVQEQNGVKYKWTQRNSSITFTIPTRNRTIHHQLLTIEHDGTEEIQAV